jgi:hypothetical protein
VQDVFENEQAGDGDVVELTDGTTGIAVDTDGDGKADAVWVDDNGDGEFTEDEIYVLEDTE